MLPKSICFVDIETTGSNATYNRIIEIGILKVVDGQIVKKITTLVNPQTYLNPFIENMTGIKYDDLQKAPLFEEIKDELSYMLEDSVFVAHNVRFDYGFIRNEFKRVGVSYKSKQICTVKLARLLYPNLRRYGLDSIIENFEIECINRHRAFDDAKVLWDFFQISQKSIQPELFQQAIDNVLKKPTLPHNISLYMLERLPEKSGVYLFKGEDGVILYIGKSINIKDRVLSHFSNDHHSATDMKISQQVKSIEYFKTAGELGALMLESALIKKHKPIFNRLLRESRKMSILLKRVNAKGYNSIEISEADSVDKSDISDILGVFRNLKQTKVFLYNVAKEFKLCPKIMGLEKGKGYCFNYQLNLCEGACESNELNLKYNLRFDEAFYTKKIRPWNFNRPIIIKEVGDISEAHLIDKWCYLGSTKSNEGLLSEITRDYRFDFDTYKILNRFIMNPKNQPKIQLVS